MEQQRKGRRARLTALAAAISAASAPAAAATFEVTTTAPTGEGSLAQAIGNANESGGADTIVINTGGTISLAGGYNLPQITDAVTITGPGNLTIDAADSGESPVFSFNSGESGPSSLSGLRIRNAQYGAIEVFNYSSVTVSDVEVVDSGYAENPNEGAAVEVFEGADLTIADSTFSGNLTSNGTIWARGEGTDLTIEDSLIRDNTKYDGGGAGVLVTDEASAEVYRSTLSGNNSSNDGGAIYVYDDASLYVEASTFSKNTADTDGGAIAVSGEGSLEVRDSVFDRNICFDEGGALYVTNGASASIYDSVFTKNLIEPEDDEPLVAGRATPEEIDDEGGAIYVSDASLSMYRSTVSGSAATLGGGIYGGDEGYINLVDSVVKNNEAVDGGGIYITEGSYLRLEGSTVTGNTATDDGGGIFADYANLALFESTIRNNSAVDNGGGIEARGNTVNIYDSQILDNSAGDGGGIRGGNLYSLRLNGSVVSGNSATEDGGGLDVDLYYDDGYLSIRRSTIADNRGADGNAIEIDMSGYNTGFIVGSTISGNAGSDAEAIDLSSSYNATLYIQNSTFSGNRASGNRVAISTYMDRLVVRNSTFVDNTGQGTGTAQIHFAGSYDSTYNVALQNSILSSNNDDEVIIGGAYLEASGAIGGNPDIYAELTANIMEAGFVIAAEGATTGGSFGAIPTDPQLGPLTDNGGPTETHAPTSASAPGIGQAIFSRPDDEDQRGADTVGDADLGAVEYTDNTPPRLVSNLTGSLSGTVGKEIEPIVVLDYFVDDEGDDISVDNVTGLPAGLSFNEGAIGGTLTAAGEYPVSVTVSDDGDPSLSRTVSATVKVRDSAPLVFIDDDDDSGSLPLAGLSLLGALAWLRRRRY